MNLTQSLNTHPVIASPPNRRRDRTRTINKNSLLRAKRGNPSSASSLRVSRIGSILHMDHEQRFVTAITFPVTASAARQSIVPSPTLSSKENSRNPKMDCRACARSDGFRGLSFLGCRGKGCSWKYPGYKTLCSWKAKRGNPSPLCIFGYGFRRRAPSNLLGEFN